jgi:hypothetical protein
MFTSYLAEISNLKPDQRLSGFSYGTLFCFSDGRISGGLKQTLIQPIILQ